MEIYGGQTKENIQFKVDANGEEEMIANGHDGGKLGTK